MQRFQVLQKTGLIADTPGAELVIRVQRAPGGSVAIAHLSSYEGVGRVRVSVAGARADEVVDALWASRSSQFNVHVLGGLPTDEPINVSITLLPSDGDVRRKSNHFKIHDLIVF